jgi:hypothetical protein
LEDDFIFVDSKKGGIPNAVIWQGSEKKRALKAGFPKSSHPFADCPSVPDLAARF